MLILRKDNLRMLFEESPFDDAAELELPRGDVTEGVVRVGSTVRRPMQPQSGAVVDYLQHLDSVGFRGAPRFLGRDRAGRDVLDYLVGEVAGEPPEPWVADDGLLVSVGQLLRHLHDASDGYAADRGFAAPTGTSWFTWPQPSPLPASGVVESAAELVSHNDVTPRNVVVRRGRATGLIDFDMAGPTTRVEDFVNTATHWVPLRAPGDEWPGWPTSGQPERLRLLADTYGLTPAQRKTLVDVALSRADRMWLVMKSAADHLGGGWARMWDEGVGDLIRRRHAWLTVARGDINAALD